MPRHNRGTAGGRMTRSQKRAYYAKKGNNRGGSNKGRRNKKY